MDPQTNPQSTNASADQPLLPRIPTSWPGAFGIYKYSKQAVKPNIWVYVGVYLLLAVVSVILEALFHSNDGSHMIIRDIINAIFSAFFTGATVSLWLAGVKGRHLSFGEAMNAGVTHFLNLIVLGILVYVSLAVSLVLLIIPFFFVLPRLALTPYYLIDKNMSPLDAYKASWNETKGHSLKVWSIFGVMILIGLLAITIIGIPFAIYFYIMYSAAMAVLYSYIQQHPAQAAGTVAAPAPKPVSSAQNDTPTTPLAPTPPAV